jgi:hypothetical protein
LDTIQRDHVFGDADRMVERQQDDRRADAQRAGARGHRGGNDERRRQQSVPVLMVFAEEARVETARLRELRFRAMTSSMQRSMCPPRGGFAIEP